MELRPALTTLLVQFPPSAMGIAGLVGGFLGSGLPGIRLARVGQGASAAMDGVLWGNLLAGLAALAVGVVVLVGARRAGATRTTRARAAWSILAGGPVGAGCTLLGIAAGLVASGAVPPSLLGGVLADAAWSTWPCLVIPAIAAGAVALSALEARPQ